MMVLLLAGSAATLLYLHHHLTCKPYNMPISPVPTVKDMLDSMQTSIKEGNIGAFAQSSTRESMPVPSFAEQAIAKDLAPWREKGFTLEVLQQAWEQVSKRCQKVENGFDQTGSDAFRFQIISGELYIETEGSGPCCGNTEWWPSRQQAESLFAHLGPSVHAMEGRAPLTILGLFEALRRFPGQVPDVDGFITMGDFPCFARDLQGYPEGQPPPAFSYSADSRHVDIPFPDFSYWRHEDINLAHMEYDAAVNDFPVVNHMQGWERQLRKLRTKWKLPWKHRKPKAFWRGVERGVKTRQALLQCPEPDPLMPRKAKDDDVIDICTTWLNPECEQINKIQMCDYRYLLRVQGNAWSHSLKHQLACGTVVIFVNPHYTDFFSRALKPSEDVLWVTDMNPATLCDHIKGLMQNMTQEEGQRLADASKRFIEENLLMDKVYGYIIKLLQEYAKLQRFNPVRTITARHINESTILKEFHPEAWDQIRTAYPQYLSNMTHTLHS